MTSEQFLNTIEVYFEDQRIDALGEGTTTFWNLKEKLNTYRDALAYCFEPGTRHDTFIDLWDRAVWVVNAEIVDSVRFAMVPTDAADQVMIFKIRAM